jgi:hypothetical protein
MFDSSCSSHSSRVTCPCDTFDPISFFSSFYLHLSGRLAIPVPLTSRNETMLHVHQLLACLAHQIYQGKLESETPSFLYSVIALMRPRLTSWCILIFRAATPPVKYNAPPLPIVLPRWQPSLGRFAREAVGMVPTGPRVISLDVELRVTHLAGPKKGGRW